MNTEFFWTTLAALEDIQELPGDANSINIESTDDEPESHYSATESDKAFIVSDKIENSQDDGDSDYEPPDVKSEDSSGRSDENEVRIRLSLVD